MASEKISALAALGTAPASTDLLVMVDVSDTSMAPTGTTKRMTVDELIGSKFWDLNGTTVGAVKTIGTIDAYALPFITNNVERARIDTSGNFGVGLSTLTARTHIKGSTNDDTAFAFKADNSSSSELLHIRNDGFMYAGISAAPTYSKYTLHSSSGTASALCVSQQNGTSAFISAPDAISIVNTNTASSGRIAILGFTDSYGGYRYGAVTSTFQASGGTLGLWTKLASNTTIQAVHINSAQQVGVGQNFTSPTASLHIESQGSTSATYGLKVQNSSGVLSLQVRDDGSVYNLGGGSVSTNAVYGELALLNNVSGDHLSAFGYEALRLTTGASNSAFGYQAGVNTSTGTRNSFFGAGAGSANTTGIQNVFIGSGAGGTSVGNDNSTFVGYNCGSGINSSNTAFGYLAMGGATTGGVNNTAIGAGVMYSITSATLNVGVGYNSFGNLTSGNQNVGLGYEAGRYNTTQSNELFIHNGLGVTNRATSLTNSLIYGIFDAAVANQALHINAGHINVDDLPTGRASVNVGELFVDTAANILAAGDLVVARKV